MKKINIIPVIALAALVTMGTVSCSKDNTDNATGGAAGNTPVKFSTNINTLTLKSKASGSAWADGDQVGIYMKKAGEDLSLSNIISSTTDEKYANVLYTAGSDNKLTPSGDPIMYPREGKVDFIGYYPYTSDFDTDGSTMDVLYPLNVSTANQADRESIDFLYSDNLKERGFSTQTISLYFFHKMSMIKVALIAGNGVSEDDLEDAVISIAGFPNEGKFDISNGKFTGIGSIADIDLVMDELAGTALVFPTEATSGYKINLTLASGKTYDAVDIPNNIKLPENTRVEFNVTVDDDIMEIYSMTIEDWVVDPETEGSLISENLKAAMMQPNSYIVNYDNTVGATGTINIPVAKAYAMWLLNDDLATFEEVSLTDEVTPVILWSDDNEFDQRGPVEISLNGTGSNATIQVIIPVDAMGNLVVGAEINGELRWSWHIWVTDMEAITAGDVDLMDRNLGAIEAALTTSGTDPDVLGMYYQWGRKDPMPYDYIFKAPDFSPLPITNIDADGSDKKVNLKKSIMNPGVLITSSVGDESDWYDFTSSGANKFWDVEKTPFDPCPAGWQMPNISIFDGAKFDDPGISTSNDLGVFPLAGAYSNSTSIGYANVICYIATVGGATTDNLISIPYHASGIVPGNDISGTDIKKIAATPVRCVKYN